MECRTLHHEVLARARPLRHDRGKKIQRAESGAAKPRCRGKQVGENFPVAVQARPRSGANALLDPLIRIGVGAPALTAIKNY